MLPRFSVRCFVPCIPTDGIELRFGHDIQQVAKSGSFNQEFYSVLPSQLIKWKYYYYSTLFLVWCRCPTYLNPVMSTYSFRTEQSCHVSRFGLLGSAPRDVGVRRCTRCREGRRRGMQALAAPEYHQQSRLAEAARCSSCPAIRGGKYTCVPRFTPSTHAHGVRSFIERKQTQLYQKRGEQNERGSRNGGRLVVEKGATRRDG